MEKDPFPIGAAIRRRRKVLGLTQEELAQRAGTDKTAITRIETGQRQPRADTVGRLADALEATVEELMGKVSETTTSPSKTEPQRPDSNLEERLDRMERRHQEMILALQREFIGQLADLRAEVRQLKEENARLYGELSSARVAAVR